MSNITDGTTYPVRALASSTVVYLLTHCGVFRSLDKGLTFKAVDMGPAYTSTPELAFLDESTLYFGSALAVFQLKLTDSKPKELLTMKKAFELYAGVSRACGKKSAGIAARFTISAYGQDIFVSMSGIMFVSRDGGTTWSYADLRARGYEVAEISGTVYRLAGKYFVHAGGHPLNSVNVGTPDGRCVPGEELRQVLNRQTTAGLYQFNPTQNLFHLIETAPELLTSLTPSPQGIFGQRIVISPTNQYTFTPVTSPNGLTWQDLPLKFNGRTEFMTATSKGRFQLYYSGHFTKDPVGAAEEEVITLPNNARARAAAAAGEEIYLLIDQGLLVSRDGGSNFSQPFSFRSKMCIQNWAFTDEMAGSGRHVLANTDNRMFSISSDGGKTLEKQFVSRLAWQPFMPVEGSGLVIGKAETLQLSTDTGLTWTGVGNEYRIPNSPMVIRNLTDGAAGYYVSEDGANRLAQVIPHFTNHVTSAYSSGNRITASAYGGGIITVENGQVIYRNADIQQNGGSVWIKIVKVQNVLYALGDALWASYDNGTTFTRLPDVPFGPRDIFLIGDKVAVRAGGYLNISGDQGRSFSLWTSCMDSKSP